MPYHPDYLALVGDPKRKKPKRRKESPEARRARRAASKVRRRERNITRDLAEPRPYMLYVLKLENNCWYVGITRNVENRFKTHRKGVGAMWTKLHKPIKVHETRLIGNVTTSFAANYEDTVTLEYALLHGYDYVRGGGYCQTNPRWP